MSWSLSYNGIQNFIIADGYHRIGVSCKLKQLLNPATITSFQSLINAGLHHIVITVNDDDAASCKSPMLNQIRESLLSYTTEITTASVIFSLIFDSVSDSTGEIISILAPNICILPYVIDKFQTKETLTRVSDSLSPDLQVMFGIRRIPKLGVDLEHIQALLDHVNSQSSSEGHRSSSSSKTLNVLDFDDLELPSFKLRAADFSHARGLNAYVHIPSLDINFARPSSKSAFSLECIDQMSELYGKHKITVLTKILLQFGFTPIFPLLSVSEDFLIKHIAPICHPLTNRRIFFSAVEIKRFVVSQEHMDEVAAVR